MEIHEFLSSRPLLKIYSIEKALGIPRGTIRRGKPVPEKYREGMSGMLRAYGYSGGDSRYFTRSDTHGVYICYMDGIVKRKRDIADDTPVELG